jgi:hypothetical protein
MIKAEVFFQGYFPIVRFVVVRLTSQDWPAENKSGSLSEIRIL